jgi:hypothetical protein
VGSAACSRCQSAACCTWSRSTSGPPGQGFPAAQGARGFGDTAVLRNSLGTRSSRSPVATGGGPDPEGDGRGGGEPTDDAQGDLVRRSPAPNRLREGEGRWL